MSSPFETIVEASNVSLAFKGVNAIQDVSFAIKRGDVTAIIGPNGAGKSSMLNVLNGIYRPSSGRIAIAGRAVKPGHPEQVARLGVARTFQNLALFKKMNVLENTLTGLSLFSKASFLENALQIGRARREQREQEQRALQTLEFLGIAELRDRIVSTLPYGVQKRVELARALVSHPSVLLLDEPMAGMTADEKYQMCRFVLDTRAEFNTTVVLIEHDMGVVMDISDHVVVLESGRKIADGTPQAVQSDQQVIDAYLGTAHELAA